MCYIITDNAANMIATFRDSRDVSGITGESLTIADEESTSDYEDGTATDDAAGSTADRDNKRRSLQIF